VRARVAKLGQHLPRVFQVHAAAIGQRDATLVAVEQAHAELVLERANLFAERRLRDVDRVGRAAKAQVRRDRDERRKLPEIGYDTSPMSSWATTGFSIKP
jgi:hypothetical protein